MMTIIPYTTNTFYRVLRKDYYEWLRSGPINLADHVVLYDYLMMMMVALTL